MHSFSMVNLGSADFANGQGGTSGTSPQLGGGGFPSSIPGVINGGGNNGNGASNNGAGGNGGSNGVNIGGGSNGGTIGSGSNGITTIQSGSSAIDWQV